MTLDDTARTDALRDRASRKSESVEENAGSGEENNGSAQPFEASHAATEEHTIHAKAAPAEGSSAADTDPLRAAPNPDTAFGQAVWLMMNTPQFKHTFLADLEWMILPAILLEQYHIFYAEGRVVGFAAWAYVSDEIKQRLEGSNARLQPAEWKSGRNFILTELFSPFGGQKEMLDNLRNFVTSADFQTIRPAQYE